jgi:signal transduction histidine kinase
MRREAAVHSVRVLLIEDDEDDYILTRDALRSIGAERMVLDWVSTPAQALTAMVSGRHDVCLLDYRLGEMTGLELLEQARRQGWQGPVILLTGVGDNELDHSALEAGAADFLVKSQLTATLLERSIRYALQHARTQARLLRAERMASLGMLAAGIAHEINNPLAFTLSNLEHLEEQVLPGLGLPGGQHEEVRRLLSDARLGASRVRDIARQLKMFSRAGEDAQPAPVEVHRVLETAINMVANELRHRARLVRDYSEPLVVEANEGSLGQVFLNLLVNAAQAIPEGNAEQQEIRITTRAHLQGAMIEVRDTGSGIPAELLERLFEPFFTTKPIGVGTGLGLSICHDIVTGFGGRMEVESQVGKGSCFRVILRGATLAPAVEAPRAAELPAVSRRGRILVVDDELLIGMAIRRMLQREHEVVTLTSAREAQARLMSGERFDVILCDVMMPEMSGVELYQELVGHVPEQAERMVFLTGGAFTPGARAFLSSVGNRQVEKPFSAQQLRELVQALLASLPELPAHTASR